MANACSEVQARLLVDGRACSVHPLRGSALGRVAGVVVGIGSDTSLAVEAGWMPGRIALVSAGGLTTDALRRLVGHHGDQPFAGVVVVVDERDDLSRLGAVSASVPAVVAGRSADRRWLDRAVCADLSVHLAGQPPAVTPTRPRRERPSVVQFGEPGTVRY